MRVLVGCECSGIVRRAFAALGYDVWSCDLKPAEVRLRLHVANWRGALQSSSSALQLEPPMFRFLARLFGGNDRSSQKPVAVAKVHPKDNRPLQPASQPAVARRNIPASRVVWRENSFPMEVVGESGFQDALVAISGGHNRYGHYLPCEAEIMREPSNPHDPNAVVVLIEGRKVGYLAREQAARVSAQMVTDGVQAVRCGAQITGGWRTNQYDAGFFGVKLAIPSWGWIDFGVGAIAPPAGEGANASPWPKRPTVERPKAAKEGPLRGERVAIMGEPGDGPLAQELAASGATIMAGIGKTTTMLVVADNRPFSEGVKRSATYVRALELIAEGEALRILSQAEARALIV